MSRKTVLSLFLLGMLCAAGCGGGGGGNSSTSATITSVSASCNPTSLQAGQTTQTSQCAATVMGTGSYSSGVTWTASAGTITSAGVYTAPATVPTSGTATITAASTEDATKSGAATITITAVPTTITSVSASCLPATVQAHQTTTTSQCSATVLGTGSYSSAVTWSATYGAITTAGVYTAPLTVPASGTDTVTAVSTVDGTKSGVANITITAARTITLTPQYPIILQTEVSSNPFAVRINTNGIKTGDVIDMTEVGTTTAYTISQTDFTNGYFTASIPIYQIASFVEFTCPTSSNAVCNPSWIAMTTDQQQLVESKDGTTAYSNPGVGFDIQEYLLSSGTKEGTAPLVGSIANQNIAITVDGGSSGTGAVLSDVAFQGVNSTVGTATTGVIVGSSTWPTDELASIVAWNGYGYVTEPNVANPGEVEQFTITSSGLTDGTSVPAGDGPYAIDAATVNGVDAIVVFSRGDLTVRLFGNTPPLTLESTLATGLTNITPLGTVHTKNISQGSAIGGWPLRIIGSGTAAGTVGVLSTYDNMLDLLTITGNVLSWPAGAYVAVAGNPYMIAPDPTNGAFIVASADTTNGLTTLQSISATPPYTATTITPNPALAAGFLASGILASNDGTKIYMSGFNAFDSAQSAGHTIVLYRH